MPYSDPDEQRAFQRTWIADRRKKVFKGKHCARCGKAISAKTGEFDHDKPKKNETRHKIYSRSEAHQKKELAKGHLLCKACHKKKTKKQLEHGIHKTNESIIDNFLQLILLEYINPDKGNIHYRKNKLVGKATRLIKGTDAQRKSSIKAFGKIGNLEDKLAGIHNDLDLWSKEGQEELENLSIYHNDPEDRRAPQERESRPSFQEIEYRRTRHPSSGSYPMSTGPVSINGL